MSSPASLRLRDARDRVIDLLGLGETWPLRDLPVPDERLTVPFDALARITLAFSQAGTAYGFRDKAGQPQGAEQPGTGGPLPLDTPPIREDITFTIHARKPTGREADLFAPAVV